MRRLLLAVLAVAVIWPVAPAPARAALADRAITWTVDHKHKTITVKAKLQIYLKECWSHVWTPGGGNPVIKTGRDCTKTAADIAKAIRDDIDNVWNRGYHYRCYRLIFLVEITFTTDRFTVDNDRIGVGIDRMSIDLRSHVDPTMGSKGSILLDRWDSNDPADRVEPDNGAILPTEFGYPPGNRHTYAHEFGHLLGLSDQYVEGAWVPKAGAPDDIMANSSTNFIDQSTIDRVVERNRDRLKDTNGKHVDLDDLTCELMFRAYLIGSEKDYHAAHLVDSLAARPCSRTPVTSSQDQRLEVKSESVDVWVQEDPTGPAGYRMSALLDQLALQLSVASQLPRDPRLAGLFDLPVTVVVTRANSTPATAAIPPLFDLQSGACAGGGGGPKPRSDCGRREYKTWLAMQLGPGTTVWPGASLLPRTLSGLGYSELRLNTLYRNCSGPTPWPGDYKGAAGSNVTFGSLPTLDALQKVWDDWARDGKAGQLDIDGGATRDKNEPGSLYSDAYLWTLTLCPLDKDGKIPPGCP